MAPRRVDNARRRVPPHHQRRSHLPPAAESAGNRNGTSNGTSQEHPPPHLSVFDAVPQVPLTDQRLEQLLMQQNRAGPGNTTSVIGNPMELGRLYVEEQTTKFMYSSYVKDKLFPQSKFLELDSVDMEFSQDPHSVCQFMARELNLPENEVPGWWATQRKGIHATFMHHRNNVIKAIRTTFMRKSLCSDCILRNTIMLQQQSDSTHATNTVIVAAYYLVPHRFGAWEQVDVCSG
jgi:hypothetical protein